MEDGDWVLVRPPAEKDLWTPSLVKEEDSSRPLKITFSGPAKHWTDAIPIGNGRLGAMVWGGVASETLQLNGKVQIFLCIVFLISTLLLGFFCILVYVVSLVVFIIKSVTKIIEETGNHISE